MRAQVARLAAEVGRLERTVELLAAGDRAALAALGYAREEVEAFFQRALIGPSQAEVLACRMRDLRAEVAALDLELERWNTQAEMFSPPPPAGSLL
jgi:hypothetical protein